MRNNKGKALPFSLGLTSCRELRLLPPQLGLLKASASMVSDGGKGTAPAASRPQTLTGNQMVSAEAKQIRILGLLRLGQ